MMHVRALASIVVLATLAAAAPLCSMSQNMAVEHMILAPHAPAACKDLAEAARAPTKHDQCLCYRALPADGFPECMLESSTWADTYAGCAAVLAAGGGGGSGSGAGSGSGSSGGSPSPPPTTVGTCGGASQKHCPTGTYLKSGKCRSCPTGYFQARSQQTCCLACPVGQTTCGSTSGWHNGAVLLLGLLLLVLLLVLLVPLLLQLLRLVLVLLLLLLFLLLLILLLTPPPQRHATA